VPSCGPPPDGATYTEIGLGPAGEAGVAFAAVGANSDVIAIARPATIAADRPERVDCCKKFIIEIPIIEVERVQIRVAEETLGVADKSYTF
jgi:hypothetical protein